MSGIKALRSIGTVNNMVDVQRAMPDVQANFNTLATQCPQLIPVVPASGHVSILVMTDQGVWEQWELVAGTSITLTADSGAKTITISTP